MVVCEGSRSSSLLCLKPQQVVTGHRSRHMGPVHGVTCLIIVNPQTHMVVSTLSSVTTFLAIVTSYIGQALSLKASAVGSVDHYERNERARDIEPEDFNSGAMFDKIQ